MTILYLADGQGTVELTDEKPQVPPGKQFRTRSANSINGESDVSQISETENEDIPKSQINEESSGNQ